MDIREVVEESLAMEFASMLVYQDLAGRVIDEDAREVLRFLARGEETHVARLIEIFSSRGSDSGELVDEVKAISLFRSRARENLERALREKGITGDSPVQEVLDFARESERRAYEHYLRLSENAKDEDLAHLFRDLAEEEKNHEVSVIRLRDLFA